MSQVLLQSISPPINPSIEHPIPLHRLAQCGIVCLRTLAVFVRLGAILQPPASTRIGLGLVACANLPNLLALPTNYLVLDWP